MTIHQTFLAIKAFESDDGRWIEGWATTPRQDLAADVVEPEGAKFNLPIPLLFAHKHDEPIGSVVEARVTRAGIRIRAKLTAGVARAEETWKLILDGALTAVSIGFSGLKATPIAGGGMRFNEWLWHELSVVSVPCNPDARISVAKCAVFKAPQPPAEKPQPAKPAIYVPHQDVVKDFESACKCLPGLPVSPERSYKLGKHWQLYDVDGALLGVVPPLPEAKPAPAPSTAKSQTSKAVTMKGLEAFGEEFAKAVGKAIVNAVDPLKQRIAELESRQNGMKFMGEFQDALSYPIGAVVKHGGDLYCAVRDIAAAKSIPGRHGAGWTKMS